VLYTRAHRHGRVLRIDMEPVRWSWYGRVGPSPNYLGRSRSAEDSVGGSDEQCLEPCLSTATGRSTPIVKRVAHPGQIAPPLRPGLEVNRCEFQADTTPGSVKFGNRRSRKGWNFIESNSRNDPAPCTSQPVLFASTVIGEERGWWTPISRGSWTVMARSIGGGVVVVEPEDPL